MPVANTNHSDPASMLRKQGGAIANSDAAFGSLATLSRIAANWVLPRSSLITPVNTNCVSAGTWTCKPAISWRAAAAETIGP